MLSAIDWGMGSEVGVVRFELDGHPGNGGVHVFVAYPRVSGQELVKLLRLRFVETEEGPVGQQVEEFLGRRCNRVWVLALVVVVELIHKEPPITRLLSD